VLVPARGQSGVPHRVLEVGADGGERKESIVRKIWGNLGAGDAGVGLEVGEAIGDGVVSGLE
jgi:hypothetical protein